MSLLTFLLITSGPIVGLLIVLQTLANWRNRSKP